MSDPISQIDIDAALLQSGSTGKRPMSADDSDNAKKLLKIDPAQMMTFEGDVLSKPTLGFTSGSGSGDVVGTSEILDATKGAVEVGGMDEVKNLLLHLVLIPFINKGIQGESIRAIPKGLVLYGQPGTGKTLLAKHLAWRISKSAYEPVHFYKVSGTELYSSYVSMSETNIRNLFSKAIRTKPSVIFFDEIDSLCPNRNTLGQSNITNFYVSVVNTMLAQFDRVEPGDVLIVAATNRLSAIDPAIRRPGRFDKSIEINLPNEAERFEILKIHSKKFYKDKDALLKKVAKRAKGLSGADLENLCLRVTTNASKKFKTPKEMGMDENSEYFKKIKGENMAITEADWDLALKQINEEKQLAGDKTY